VGTLFLIQQVLRLLQVVLLPLVVVMVVCMDKVVGLVALEAEQEQTLRLYNRGQEFQGKVILAVRVIPMVLIPTLLQAAEAVLELLVRLRQMVLTLAVMAALAYLVQ
jgi:hypothetical protein